MKRLLLLVIITVTLSLATGPLAAELKPRKPDPADKCPVCGMLVAKYTDFIAQLQFKDGAVVFFDGPKDLFKYYRGLSHAKTGKKQPTVVAVFVTSYYTLNHIDGLKAYYVTGSDVFGPMGGELIAFEKEADAREFRKDHKGKAILRFRDVTPSVIKELD